MGSWRQQSCINLLTYLLTYLLSLDGWVHLAHRMRSVYQFRIIYEDVVIIATARKRSNRNNCGGRIMISPRWRADRPSKSSSCNEYRCSGRSTRPATRYCPTDMTAINSLLSPSRQTRRPPPPPYKKTPDHPRRSSRGRLCFDQWPAPDHPTRSTLTHRN